MPKSPKRLQNTGYDVADLNAVNTWNESPGANHMGLLPTYKPSLLGRISSSGTLGTDFLRR